MDNNNSNHTKLMQLLSKMARKKSKNLRSSALDIFRKHGRILRTSEAVFLGILPRFLYKLRDSGKLELLLRGAYAISRFDFLARLESIFLL